MAAMLGLRLVGVGDGCYWHTLPRYFQDGNMACL